MKEEEEEKAKKELVLRMEFADNGSIIRNMNEGEVRLVLSKATKALDGHGVDVDHSEEHKALGARIYSWLEECMYELADLQVKAEFELDIVATFDWT